MIWAIDLMREHIGSLQAAVEAQQKDINLLMKKMEHAERSILMLKDDVKAHELSLLLDDKGNKQTLEPKQ